MQRRQGFDPNSKVQHGPHSAFLAYGSWTRSHCSFQQGVGPSQRQGWGPAAFIAGRPDRHARAGATAVRIKRVRPVVALEVPVPVLVARTVALVVLVAVGPVHEARRVESRGSRVGGFGQENVLPGLGEIIRVSHAREISNRLALVGAAAELLEQPESTLSAALLETAAGGLEQEDVLLADRRGEVQLLVMAVRDHRHGGEEAVALVILSRSKEDFPFFLLWMALLMATTAALGSKFPRVRMN